MRPRETPPPSHMRPQTRADRARHATGMQPELGRAHTCASTNAGLASRTGCVPQFANNATLNVRGEERQIRLSSAPVGHRVVGVLADRSAAGLFTSPRPAATTPQRLMTSFAKHGSLCRSTRRRHDFLFGSTRPRRKPRRSGRAGDKPDARSASVSASRLGCSMRKAAVAHDGDTRLLGGCFRLSRSPRPQR